MPALRSVNVAQETSTHMRSTYMKNTARGWPTPTPAGQPATLKMRFLPCHPPLNHRTTGAAFSTTNTTLHHTAAHNAWCWYAPATLPMSLADGGFSRNCCTSPVGAGASARRSLVALSMNSTMSSLGEKVSCLRRECRREERQGKERRGRGRGMAR